MILRHRPTVLRLLSVLLLATPCERITALTLAPIFDNHMVLQRNKPVTIWGEAPANQRVEIHIEGITRSGVADQSGQWKVTLPAQEAGGPFQLTVIADERRQLSDIYYGDVWIAGGQSNMEWKMSAGITDAEQALADTHYPQIRFFDIPNTLATTPQQQLPASEWQIANPATAKEFSAVAWFFAKNLHLEQGVAVGIIESNWGGTPAEAWTDISRLSALEGYQQIARQVQSTKDWSKRLQENEKRNRIKYELIDDLNLALATKAHLSETDVSHWDKRILPNQSPLSELAWLRKNFTLESKPVAAAELYLGDIEQNALIFVNGHFIAKEDWRHRQSKHRIPADFLNQGHNQITLRVANDWNNRAFILAPEGDLWLKTGSQTISLAGEWFHNNQIQPALPKVERYNQTAGFLYNAMIHPLLPYASKGVIWYQGESNVGAHAHYEALFTALINNWRQKAGDEQLPFLFVQLAAFLEPEAVQPDSAWAYLRDAQRRTTKLPFTGMATAIDVGETNNVHPANKKAVGDRLWLQARKLAYGVDIVASGPDFIRITIEDSMAKVKFQFAEELRTTDGEAPRGFIIAGNDKVFYPAKATLSGNSIILSNPSVPSPVAVRYAWADFPIVNLVNQVGLPAVPFRTDSWLQHDVSSSTTPTSTNN